MAHVLDMLFIKRFCLPSNIDIQSYETGKSKITSCLCGNYNHASCLLDGYKGNDSLDKANILSIGYNTMGDIYGNVPGVHAERDAINKLKPLSRRKRLQPVNMLVIRLTTQNKLQNSKPCANCIREMRLLPEKKGYRIKYIYYSNNHGDIIKRSLDNLENDELHYSRFFRRNRSKNNILHNY